MSAFLGGFTVIDIRGAGLTAIAVTVASNYTDRYFQLYAGRRMIGVTDSPGQMRIVGQLQPSHCPPGLTIVMVDDEDRLTNFGPQLPKRPSNQFQLDWEAEDFPADSKWFELAAATEADGAVDPDNVIARVGFRGDGSYGFILPPIDAPGDWTYRVTSRDNAFPAGTAGTPANVTKSALPYPPDVAEDDDGIRLSAEVDASTLTVNFEFDW